MSGKTLSTGTLSLRFMQNANRAKQLKEVELDRAEVIDAGKWEIGQDVKDAWGTTSSSPLLCVTVVRYRCSNRLTDKIQILRRQAVQHESSYLPFLFSEPTQESSVSTESVNTTLPKGRRVFNKKGEEIEEVLTQVLFFRVTH